MPSQRFLIAPLVSGTQSNVKPWLITDEAFESMRNMYTWRGSVKKRVGARVMNATQDPPFDQLFTRLRVNVRTTSAGGIAAFFVPGTIFKVGQMFSIADELFTVNFAGTPAVMLDTGAAVTKTFDTTTGAFSFVGVAPFTTVFYYPAEPVMHFGTYETSAVNDEILFAFDTQFAYTFSYGTGWSDTLTGANDTWSGTNADFFWTTNWRGTSSADFLMFVTNNVRADAMRYWDGAAWNAFGSAATTSIDGTAFIKTCKIILPFQGRLLLMNVTENDGGGGGGVDTTYANRIRFSKMGSPVDADSWTQTPGGSSFIGASVKEAIISAEFLKDRLIIFFERSTWELVYTGNEVVPFRFQQINTELGVESMQSVIPFDKIVLGVGSNGIHACNGVNVERIDDLIPDTVFDISNDNNGPRRVHGIRDFYVEVVYWTYSSNIIDDGFNNTFPNRILVFDYKNSTWAYNDDSITAFGNFQLQKTLFWEDIAATWQQMDTEWNDPSLEDRFKSVIAGNQEGYTFIVDSLRNKNSIALQITDISIIGNIVTFTCYDHNLAQDEAVYFTDIQAAGGNLADADIINGKIFVVDLVVNKDNFTINMGDVVVAGLYTGGGVITRVSFMELVTKQYNFFNKIGMNMSVNQVDVLVDKTENGQINVACGVSSSNTDTVTAGVDSGSILGTAILETTPYASIPLEETQDRFWHSLYFQAEGENVGLIFYLSPEQITDPAIAFSDFQLNAMMFYANQTRQFGG